MPLRDAGDDELLVRLRVVEVRADGAGRAGVGERVAAPTAGAREDCLAGGRVALSFSAGSSSVGVVAAGSVPTTVSGVAVVSSPSRQPAASRPSASASARRATKWVRRITAESNQAWRTLA